MKKLPGWLSSLFSGLCSFQGSRVKETLANQNYVLYINEEKVSMFLRLFFNNRNNKFK